MMQCAGYSRFVYNYALSLIKESWSFEQVKASDRKGLVAIKLVTVQKLKPTQRCNNCWELTPKTLSDRLHVCSHCGHTEDRDINSAQVCLTWARGKDASLVRRRFPQLYFNRT